MFYRFLMILLLSILITPALAADYEVNLSVLDSLNLNEEESAQLPFPAKPGNISKSNKPKSAPDFKAPVAPHPVKAENKTEETPKQPETPAEIVVPQEEILPATEVINEPEPDEKHEMHDSEEVVTEPVAEPNEDIRPEEKAEIKDNETEIATEDNSFVITFSDDSDELERDAIAKLSALCDRIDPKTPVKILIEAYYYSNGENSFSRKRLSLSRSVNIRSYLLNKGYKSFSIKIINTEDASLRNYATVTY